MYQKIYKTMNARKDGLGISVLMLIPEGKNREIKGIVQLVHGMCEYKERYLPFMEYLTEQGYLAIIHDHRGHGESIREKEDLGYMYGGGADALLDDILQVTENVRARYPGLPLILMGHSMGSLAVRAFAADHDDLIDALIVCGSPSSNPARPFGSFLASVEKRLLGGKHRAKLIEKLSFGGYAAKFGKNESALAWLCSDPDVVAEYEASDYCGFTFTADGYQVLFDLMKRAYKEKGWKCSKPNLPILFIGGADDPCIGGVRKFSGSVNRMRMAGYCNVKGKLYRGLRHEILNEKENARVYRDIAAYLRKNGL